MSELEKDVVAEDGLDSGQTPSDGRKDKDDARASGLEVREAPILNLEVQSVCNNPNGNYVALNPLQRKALGVGEGDTVMLRSGGKVFSYTVGAGLNKLKQGSQWSVDDPIGANGISFGRVEIFKADKEAIDYQLQEFPLVKGVEGDSKHPTRSQKITDGRFGDKRFDGSVYLVLPTAVAKSIMYGSEDVALPKATIAPISLGQIKIGDKVMEIPVVPSGTGFGMTTAAAKFLDIQNDSSSTVEFYIKDGVLVINQIK